MEATLPRMAVMRPRLPWVSAAVAVALAVVIVIVALTQARDPYPLPPGGGSSVLGPSTLGTPIQTVVVFFEPRPGDRIELLGAEPIGLPPDVRPTLYLSRAVPQADGTWLTGEALEPLAGAVIEVPAGASPGPEHGVGIVAEMTPQKAGVYTLTGVRLRFSLNGGGAQVREGTSVIWTICADDPAPATCVPPGAESEPRDGES
jgi:hypothetical protein